MEIEERRTGSEFAFILGGIWGDRRFVGLCYGIGWFWFEILNGMKDGVDRRIGNGWWNGSDFGRIRMVVWFILDGENLEDMKIKFFLLIIAYFVNE